MINKQIYFFDKYGNFREGKIIATHDDYVDVYIEHFGTMTIKKDCYFNTKEECIINQNTKDNDYKNKIKRSIKSISDLFHFTLNNCVAPAEEYTDWVAREAVIERAVELGVKF